MQVAGGSVLDFAVEGHEPFARGATPASRRRTNLP